MRRPKTLYSFGYAIVLMVLVLSGTPASACRELPRPLEQKIANSGVIFIGTVLSVVNRIVRFQVDVPLRGINAAGYEVEQVSNSCGINFRVGQRWLFAGASLPDGSLELEAMQPSEIQVLQSIMLKQLSEMTPEQKIEVQKLINNWPRYKKS